MKKALKLFLTAVLFAGVFSACNTNKDIVLSADCGNTATDGQVITFSVKSGGDAVLGASIKAEYVTADDRVHSAVLDSYVYTIEEPGEYTFIATFDGLTSNALVINVQPALVLSANKEEIAADGIDRVTFSVTYDGKRVTDAVILDGDNPIDGYYYTTTVDGDHIFTATYEGQTSNDLKISAKTQLVLKADKYGISLDGTENVNFTLMYNGSTDVTADAKFYDSMHNLLPSPSFSSNVRGSYDFYATYEVGGNTITSNTISIYVIDTNFDFTKEIVKNVAFFTFTATWCGPCYDYKTNLKQYINQFSPNIVQLNLHVDGGDAIGTSTNVRQVVNQLANDGRFRVSGFPTAIADLRKDLAPGNIPGVTNIDSAYKQYSVLSPKTGTLVDSRISGDKIEVMVTVAAKETGSYYVAVFLMEDHIMAAQTGHSGLYDHTNFAQEIGSSASDINAPSIFGYPLGKIEAGQFKMFNTSFDILSKYNRDNLSLFVYTLYEDGGKNVIDNARKVTASGMSGFDYVE